MSRLLVIIPDRVSDILVKGEYQPLYYNPHEVFNEVHLLLTNDDKPDMETMQRTVGRARLFLHNHPEDYGMPTRFDAKRTPHELKEWARGGVKIARKINPDLIRCHGADWNTYLASRIKAELGIPYVVSLHINYDENPPRRLRGPLTPEQERHNAFYDYVERTGLASATLIAPVYKPILPYLDRIGAKNVEVCYNVLDGDNLRQKDDYRLSNPPRLLYVGRLFDDKDPSNILRALTKIPGAHYTIVGDGPARTRLEALISELGLSDRVEFKPAVINADLCQSLPSYDLFVIHTEYFEISKSLLEALLTGLPVIVNRRKGAQVPELHEGIARLVDNTPEGYHTAISELLSDDSAREKLGRAAYAEAERRYAPARTEAKITAHYRRLSHGRKTMAIPPLSLSQDRKLMLVCGYRGAAKNKRPPSPGSFTGNIALYRDHYANPREPDLQRQMTQNAFGSVLSEFEIRVDDSVSAAWPAQNAQQLRAFSSREARGYDCIVMSYPDPLGLTWDGLEDRLLSTGTTVYVLNGRGRLFELTPQLRSALSYRRFLAASRIVETAMGCVSIPTAGVLAMYDAARGRT